MPTVGRSVALVSLILLVLLGSSTTAGRPSQQQIDAAFATLHMKLAREMLHDSQPKSAMRELEQAVKRQPTNRHLPGLMQQCREMLKPHLVVVDEAKRLFGPLEWARLVDQETAATQTGRVSTEGSPDVSPVAEARLAALLLATSLALDANCTGALWAAKRGVVIAPENGQEFVAGCCAHF